MHILCIQIVICDALYDLVPSAQFKNVKNTHGDGGVLHPAALLKVTFVRGCFSRFLNCTNGTKSCNSSYIQKKLKNMIMST